jgi:hypothetical protein
MRAVLLLKQGGADVSTVIGQEDTGVMPVSCSPGDCLSLRTDFMVTHLGKRTASFFTH